MKTQERVATAHDAVVAGAEALDRIRPGWYYTVNVTELRMASGYNCIIGQVFGTYGDVYRQIARQIDPGNAYLYLEESYEAASHLMTEHGFYVPMDNAPWTYAQLHYEWVTQIELRRGANN